VDRFLTRWQQAGLITSDQVSAIGAFEQKQPQRATTAGRPSGVEILVTLGTAIALVGTFTLIYANTSSLSVQGVLTLGVALAAAWATNFFRRQGTPVGMRAAGSCAALTCAAIGIGIGELAASAWVFSHTATLTDYGYSYTQTDSSGAVAFGAAVAALLAIWLLVHVPGPLLTLVMASATYTVSGVLISWLPDQSNPDHNAVAVILLATSATLLAVSRVVIPGRGESRLLALIATTGLTVPLYFLGGDHWIHLDVVGAILSVVILIYGLRNNLDGVAYGGSVGLGGLIFDIGGRNFGSSATAFGVYLIIAGVVFVAGIIALSRRLKMSPFARP